MHLLCYREATKSQTFSFFIFFVVLFHSCHFSSLVASLPALKTKVMNELGESLERERQREHAARTVLEGAVSKGGVVLPEVQQ